jgi:hypothetical protein
VALGTREIHRARKKLSDDSTETQNAYHHGEVQQRLAHMPSYQPSAISFQLVL